MKNYYKKIKEFLANPKKKSLTMIGIYIIFFTFVFIYIKSHNTANINNEYKEEPLISINEDVVSSYEYEADINKDTSKIFIKGTLYNNDQVLSIDNIKYYIKDNKLYLYSDKSLVEEKEFPLDKIKYDIIKKIIEDNDYESKTEYKNNKVKYEYIIDNIEFAKYFDETNNNEGNVNITIYQDKYIYNVIMDLSNYYNTNNYLMDIKYSNINNITNLDVNFEND